MIKCLPLVLLLFGLSACSPGANPTPTPASRQEEPVLPAATAPIKAEPVATEEFHPDQDPAFIMNARIGRGVNLGNALEAPREGDWGVVIQEAFFPLIKEQGFDSVRVPIKWSGHANRTPPYTIDPAFFQRVDWVVEQALKNDLVVILNIHHFDEINTDPEGQRDLFLALWQQIAERFQGAPDTVIFELLNEPNGSKMMSSVWNRLAADALDVVRATNPDRFVIVGPVNWNNVDALARLRLPEADRRLIATFHYYTPFEFTHQGAEWVSGSRDWLGTTWSGTNYEQVTIRRDLDKASRWSQEYHRPIFMGEFGAYSKADMESRARWTNFVAREAEARGFSWAYWEFSAGFGIYQADLKIWEQPLVEALLP